MSIRIDTVTKFDIITDKTVKKIYLILALLSIRTETEYFQIGGTMKKALTLLTFLAFAIVFNLNSAIAEEDWRTEYITALQDGKIVIAPSDADVDQGLAYTPSEEQVLMDAVADAMEQDASACECMKIAIDLEYNPYDVLKSIYMIGGNVTLDELCMCATEAGVMKAIIAKAAGDALSPNGEPMFSRDEIVQSQCLRGQEGLAYTPPEEGLPYTAPLSPLTPIATDSANTRSFVSPTTF